MENSSQHVVGVPLAPQQRRPWTRYVAIGDSLSEGLGDPLTGGRLRGWAVLLAEHLRQVSPEMSFTNLAVRGYRARDAIQRELPEAIALQPDLITVFIGGNDVLLTPRLDAARFADELDQLLAPFADPSVTVVLSTLPDLAAVSPLPPPLRRAASPARGDRQRGHPPSGAPLRHRAARRLGRAPHPPPRHVELRPHSPQRDRTPPHRRERGRAARRTRSARSRRGCLGVTSWRDPPARRRNHMAASSRARTVTPDGVDAQSPVELVTRKRPVDGSADLTRRDDPILLVSDTDLALPVRKGARGPAVTPQRCRRTRRAELLLVSFVGPHRVGAGERAGGRVRQAAVDRWRRMPAMQGSVMASASVHENQATSWLSSGGGAGSASPPSSR